MENKPSEGVDQKGFDPQDPYTKLPEEVGMPILGVLFPFAKSKTQFVEELVKKHGSSFRFKLLGKEVNVLHGNESLPLFFHEENITRSEPLKAQLDLLAGGVKKICPFLDGKSHKDRKKLLINLVSKTRMESYFGVLNSVISDVLRDFESMKRVIMTDYLPSFTVRFYLKMMAGLDDASLESEWKNHIEMFGNIALAFDAKAQVNVGITNYGRGRASAKKLGEFYRGRLGQFRDMIRDGKKLPPCILSELVKLIERERQRFGHYTTGTKEYNIADDGKMESKKNDDAPLSDVYFVMKFGEDVKDESSKERDSIFTDDDVILGEMVHMSTAVYSIAVTTRILFHQLALKENRMVFQELEKRVSNQGDVEFNSMKDIDSVDPYINHVIREALRIGPVIPTLVFGRAAMDFKVDDHWIMKNSLVMASTFTTNHDNSVYANPDKFDPDRFNDERTEHHRAQCPMFSWVPHGGGDWTSTHRCLGEDLIMKFLSLFLVRLIRGYKWELDEDQRLDIDWQKFDAAPKDGVKITISPK